ncbi:DUF1622 domain-containing protein [Lacibacter sp.]|uniref:DUF1622 domain-containing protein n=1 Tax=Lacibacter sp. TaxID=1915409 RepID=UPI002B4B5708|nr:DUF1622 domain-containing protein [Lacibacter sp.]HLP37225.1 DUF1622 domain-containing protein [Lacibacter sp.]
MEKTAKFITINISHTVEILAAVIIGWTVVKTFIAYFIPLKKRYTAEQVRVQFGSAVAIALELLLGADVLATAVAPSWNDIGQLTAIAILRTALNYFLSKELKEISNETS